MISTKLSTFSTSTPTRSQSPQAQPPVSFPDHSSVPTQLLTQPIVSTIPNLISQVIQAPLYPKVVQSQDFERENEEQDVILAARACFDSREFHRAAHILNGCVSPKGKFLRIYCQFLASSLSHLR